MRLRMSTSWGFPGDLHWRSCQTGEGVSRGSRILQENGKASEPGLRHMLPVCHGPVSVPRPGVMTLRNTRGSYPRAFADVKVKSPDV